MVKRLFVGLLLGLVIGGLAAAALVKGLHMAVLDGTGSAVVAYIAAALVGVVTGLIAGKPIWASGGQIEAGLKAVFGALLATGGMFAFRQWVHSPIALPADLGSGELGHLPALVLPAIAAILGGFYELDNTGTGKEEEEKKPKELGAKESGANGKARIAVDPVEEEEVEVPSKKAKR